MKKQEILQEAIHQFREKTGLSLKELPITVQQKKLRFDALVQLQLGNELIDLAVEVKNEVREIHLPGLLDQINKSTDYAGLVISQYIPKPLKESLKRQKINYLEASGNCFVHQDGVFIYINDQPVTQVRLPEQGKIWKRTGLKFLFVVLQFPHLLNESYRLLSSTSKVALGNVGPFIEELKKEGYVKRYANGKLFLENEAQLQRTWVELFVSVLRPKLKMGKFRFLNPDQFHNWQHIPTQNFVWGGEAAGALLTNYLSPQTLTIYTSHSKPTLMQELKLVPDENGNIEMVEIFWNEEDFEVPNQNVSKTVMPLVAYAELATSLDSRNRETAEKIKALYLEHER